MLEIAYNLQLHLQIRIIMLRATKYYIQSLHKYASDHL